MRNYDQMQEIRMCVQTFFNLYGTIPGKQLLIEWLGTAYADMIPEYLNENRIA